MDDNQEYTDLLKRAHDLGIIAIGGAVVNPDILRDAIASTKKIYAAPEYQRLAESLPALPELPAPTIPTKKLTHCTIQPDISLLRDVVKALEKNPLDFHAIAKEMDEMRRNPER